jgi:hypothetical protein
MTSAQDSIERYLQRAERYVENVEVFLARGEPDKAGECLWGAVALSLKAVSLRLRGRRLQTHQSIRSFAGDLARRFADPSLLTSFDAADLLHSNFYEGGHTTEDVQTRLDVLRPFIARLWELARILRQPEPSQNA